MCASGARQSLGRGGGIAGQPPLGSGGHPGATIPGVRNGTGEAKLFHPGFPREKAGGSPGDSGPSCDYCWESTQG